LTMASMYVARQKGRVKSEVIRVKSV